MSIFNFSTFKIAAVCLGVYILKKIFFPGSKPKPRRISYPQIVEYPHDFYDNDFVSSSQYFNAYAEDDIIFDLTLRNLQRSKRNRKNNISSTTTAHNGNNIFESGPTGSESIPQSTNSKQRNAKRRSKKSKNKSAKSKITCTICMEKINEDLKCLTCCHSFHGKCINQWFLHNYEHLCPICRTTNYS